MINTTRKTIATAVAFAVIAGSAAVTPGVAHAGKKTEMFKALVGGVVVGAIVGAAINEGRAAPEQRFDAAPEPRHGFRRNPNPVAGDRELGRRGGNGGMIGQAASEERYVYACSNGYVIQARLLTTGGRKTLYASNFGAGSEQMLVNNGRSAVYRNGQFQWFGAPGQGQVTVVDASGTQTACHRS